MSFLQLAGRTFLVVGVANKKSVAWHVASGLQAEGAELVLAVKDEAAVAAVGKLFPGVPLYPVQIIESACLLVIWAVLVFAYPRRKKDGAVFALYLLLYPPVRFALEYLRGDERQSWFAFDVAQVTSIALFLAGILLFAFLPKNKFSPPPRQST